MRSGAQISHTNRKNRSILKPFRNSTTNKSRNLDSGKLPEIAIRENIQTQPEQTTDCTSCSNPSALLPHRLTSASTNRPAICPSPTKSLGKAPTLRPQIANPPSGGNLLKLSQMFSTMTSLAPEKKLPTVSAHCFCVMLASSRKVILESKMEVKRQVASLTKLMTALTVLELAKRFQVDIQAQMVEVGGDAAMMEGTSAGLKNGDELRVVDLMHGMLLPSGNDAAIALATHFGWLISQSMSKQDSKRSLISKPSQLTIDTQPSIKPPLPLKLFMIQMNRLASDLGLKNTYFQNPTGLQHQKSYSTAFDMAILSAIFSSNTILKNMTQKKTYHYDIYNKKFCTKKYGSWRNTNGLLWKRKDCKGLKTGTTPWAGPCLSATFQTKNIEIIVVVLKCASPQERFIDAEKLYLWWKEKYLF